MRDEFSVGLSEEVDERLRVHLLRPDRQEDLTFALWTPSTGAERLTALIHSLLLPEHGDRDLHGNVSFNPGYFERALARAAESGCGLALVHMSPAP